jgi:hypothetical protein
MQEAKFMCFTKARRNNFPKFLTKGTGQIINCYYTEANTLKNISIPQIPAFGLLYC